MPYTPGSIAVWIFTMGLVVGSRVTIGNRRLFKKVGILSHQFVP